MILDRGYIMVEPTANMIEWLKKHQEIEPIQLDEYEPSVYLIEDDFMDDELVLKKYFEEIFVYELESTAVHESLWPSINLTEFNYFFRIKMGVTVYDLKS